jgi:hypothetical protein
MEHKLTEAEKDQHRQTLAAKTQEDFRHARDGVAAEAKQGGAEHPATPALDLKDRRFDSREAAEAAGMDPSNFRDLEQDDGLAWKREDSGLDLGR